MTTTTQPQISISADFPTSPYPKGWFVIADSQDVPKGTVKPLKYYGKDLVVWRGESGKVYLMDAHCQHLGAHIGYRGDEAQQKLVQAVVGEDVACPWHGWRWSGEGRNTHIPYANEKPKSGAKIPTYHAKDWFGMIIAWFAWDDSAPEWELPALPEFEDPSFFPVYPNGIKRWTLKGHCQIPMENSADFAHIHFVHGSAGLAEPKEFLANKHRLLTEVTVLYGRPDKATWLAPIGGRKATIALDHYGIGISIHRWGTQLWPTLLVTTFTPIDDTTFEVGYHFTAKRGPGETGDELQGKAARLFNMQKHVIEQDFFIWANQKRQKALYAVSEVPLYGRVRHWATQFYPETVSAYVDPAHEVVLSNLDEEIPLTPALAEH